MDMDKTTILLPAELRRRAARRAAAKGISLGELIRRKLLEEVAADQDTARSQDPLFRDFDELLSKGGAADAAAQHDRYLYDEE